MAFRTQKISQMTPKGADLEATDLIEVSTIESGSYVTRSITGQELIDAIPAPTGFVPTSRTLTINGVAQDLSADRSWTIATGLTIGTTPISSGTIGRVLFQGTGNVVQQSGSLTFDGTKLIVGVSGNAIPGATQILRVVNNISGSDMEINGNGYARLFFNDYSQGSNLKYYEMLNLSSDFKISRLNDLNNTRTERLTIFGATGNVNIGTTSPTDAGFKLDVNGTARIQGSTTIGTTITANTTLNILSSSRADIRLRTNASSDNAFSVYAIGGAFGSNYAQFGTNDGENSAQQGGAIYTDSRTGVAPPIRLVVKGIGTNAMTSALSIFNTANVGINTNTDISSAILNINSTTKGFLPPRMTTTQKNAITSPPAGLQVFDTTLNQMSYYNGTTWINL